MATYRQTVFIEHVWSCYTCEQSLNWLTASKIHLRNVWTPEWLARRLESAVT